MSARPGRGLVVVLWEGTRVRVRLPQGAVRTIPLPDSPVAMDDARGSAPMADVTAAIQAAAADAGDWPDVVVVVGGAWLEAARPAVPPMAPADRRRALHHVADRVFALEGPVALALVDAFALACPAAWRTALVASLNRWAQVRAVITVPGAVAAVALNGTWVADASRLPPGGAPNDGAAGDGAPANTAPQRAALHMTVQDGVVHDLRIRASAAADGAPAALDVDTLLARVQRVSWRDWPVATQLLDVHAERALVRAQRAAWWRAGAAMAVSLFCLAWSASAWRTRVLAAADAEVRTATVAAGAALEARQRLERAVAEGDLLRSSGTPEAQAARPSRVLARLGTLLPSTAFVQRLEWSGGPWRIDGSAVDAAALVPRLDADSALTEVVSLAPSVRFLDGGVARSSFAIGFRVRGAERDTARDAEVPRASR